MSAFADYQDKEVIKGSEWPPAKKLEVITLDLPVQLTDRRLYCYLEVLLNTPGAVFTFIGEIVLYKAGEIKAKYPVEIGLNSFPSSNAIFGRSIRCLANSGGSPVGDCLSIVFKSPFTTTTLNAICQPIRLEAEIDKAVFNIVDYGGTNNTGYRVYLGVLSQKQP